MVTSQLAAHLAAGPPLPAVPTVVDVTRSAPPNPPEQVQVEFVGRSFEAAYAEAEVFVAAVADQLRRLRRPGLGEVGRVLDFGSGWGRITRVLLTEVSPERLFAVDVDPGMTALVGVTLPGINVLTVTPEPPTVLADASMDVIVAFSVFSHLSAAAHQAWARELARVVRPGGVVAITVLGEDFIDLVAGSQAGVAAGAAEDFARHMAQVFPDVAAARAGFRADELQFAATGGGGVRSSDYYGWAVASRRFVERTWGAAGLDVVCWRPSGELFSQALALMVKTERGQVGRAVRGRALAAEHAAERFAGRMRDRVPEPARRVARRLRAQLKATSRSASR